ncbi:MAG: TonB-dependent receptor, partial [Acidobacteriota bacterium]|nr:TonB-dependent receptor [Acidobacteriota bacterium]
MRLNRFAAFAVTLSIVTVPVPVLSQEPAPPPAPTDPAPRASGTAPAEEPEGSFFDSTTVTALGREVDVFQVSTPVTVIQELEIVRRMPNNA